MDEKQPPRKPEPLTDPKPAEIRMDGNALPPRHIG